MSGKNMIYKHEIDYSSYNNFYNTVKYIYSKEGFVDIFSNHPQNKNREFHLIKDGVRIRFVYRMANKLNLCYANICCNVLDTDISYTVESAHYKPSDTYLLLKGHEIIKNKYNKK